MRNFKDESFIQQYLSPKVIRDFRLFALVDDDEQPNLRIGAIHNDEGYRAVRESLARQYALSEREPNIQIVSVDVGGDRSLTLRHFRTDRRPLAPMYKDVIRHLAYLWGFAVKLETASEDGSIELTHECKLERRRRGEPALAAALRSVG
jgi:spore cortex formation protein SpoVR/YcgB (stage V sporulation)